MSKKKRPLKQIIKSNPTSSSKVATLDTKPHTAHKPQLPEQVSASTQPIQHPESLASHRRRTRQLGWVVVVGIWALLVSPTICLAAAEYLQTQATTALASGQFSRASQLSTRAEEWFPVISRRSFRLTVQSWVEAQQLLAAGAVAAFNHDENIASLQLNSIPDTSPYFGQAQALLIEVDADQKTQQQATLSLGLFDEAADLIDQHDYRQALNILSGVADQTDTHARLEELRSEANAGLLSSMSPAAGPSITGPNLFVPILMYHYLSVSPSPLDKARVDLSVSPATFAEQLNYLNEHNFHSIDLDQLYQALNGKATLPPNPIVLTFDDGYKDFYQQAYPLLKQYRVRATVYVITHFTGSNPDYITWDEIKTMQQSGLVEFGSHTLDHPDLRTKDPVQLTTELQLSKKELEQHLNETVTSFCYPYGAVNDRVAAAVKQAGYIGATTTAPGSWHSDSEMYMLTRVRIKDHPMEYYRSAILPDTPTPSPHPTSQTLTGAL